MLPSTSIRRAKRMSLRRAHILFLCGFLALVAAQTLARSAASPGNGATFGKGEAAIQAVELAIAREAIQRDMPGPDADKAWTWKISPEIARVLLWGGVIFNVQLGKHGRNRTNVWNYPGMNSFARRGRTRGLDLHPTVKPIAMVSDAILDVTQRGDIVLDPFCGSGTTILAAERTGRRGYAIELDPAMSIPPSRAGSA